MTIDWKVNNFDLANARNAAELFELQTVAYKFEAEIIGFADLPPLADCEVDIQTCGESAYGVFESQHLIGCISYAIEDDTAEICRLVVQPDYFRQGVGEALLQCLLSKDVLRVQATTASRNTPAKMFYEKNGFRKAKEWMAKEGILLTEFLKEVE